MDNLELGKAGVLILGLISHYGMFGMYIGTFLLGENVIIVAFLLGAQGYIDYNQAILMAFLGSLSADLFWYFFGKAFIPDTRVLQFLRNEKNTSRTFINFLLRQKPIITFTFIKFLVGIRLFLTLGFIMTKKPGFFRYLFLCIFSNFLFILSLYGFASLAKKGIEVLPIYHNINAVLITAVGIIILIHLIPPIISYILRLKKKI